MRDARSGALVIGSTGLIGRALMRALPSRFKQVWGTVRGATGPNLLRLDLAEPVLANPQERQAFVDLSAAMRCAFFCSAVTRYEDCARDPISSYKINVTHTVELADFLLRHGVHVICLSSNAVFDGAHAMCPEDAAPTPVTEYGRQKAAAERALQNCPAARSGGDGNVTIFRLTKVLSAQLPLIAGWIGDLGSGKSIKAFDDLVFAPVSLRHAVSALLRLAMSEKPGIYHLSGSADISYHDFACALAARMGIDARRIERGHAAERAGAAPLPRFSAMRMDQTQRLIGETPQRMDEVIEDLLEEAGYEN